MWCSTSEVVVAVLLLPLLLAIAARVKQAVSTVGGASDASVALEEKGKIAFYYVLSFSLADYYTPHNPHCRLLHTHNPPCRLLTHHTFIADYAERERTRTCSKVER